jgi:hypothetical protein
MGIWGQPLANVVITTKRAVPNFLEKAFEFVISKHVDKEGIFRISGNKETRNEIAIFVDATDDIEITKLTNVHDICNTITAFIAAIPNHLFIDENIRRVSQIKTKEDAKAFIDSLPYINRILASRIFGFFFEIIKHKENNKMSAYNIAVILSPILINDPENSAFLLPFDIINLFFEFYSYIFSFNPSIDENGNWIPASDFKAPVEDIMDQFFCQSTRDGPLLKPISQEKEMKICRKIQIKDKVVEDLLADLLAGNSISQKKKKHHITPL